MMQFDASYELIRARQADLRSMTKPEVRVDDGNSPVVLARRQAALALIRFAGWLGGWSHLDPIRSPQGTAS